MSKDLGLLVPARKTGDEPFHVTGRVVDFTLLDFWRWSYSDLVDNTARGVLAEYLVAQALGLSTAGVREAWALYDLKAAGGLKIEVKSAAYVQNWFQKTLSKIQLPSLEALAGPGVQFAHLKALVERIIRENGLPPLP